MFSPRSLHLFLLLFLTRLHQGLQATVTTKSGERYTGIFSAASAEAGTSSFILKMSRKLAKNETSTSFNEVGSPYVGNAPDYALSFKAVDVSDVIVPNVPQPPTSSKPSRGETSWGLCFDCRVSTFLSLLILSYHYSSRS